ncbi:MAG: hypothetical protein ACR2HQ_07040 [Ilumatobacteraceae bacterium]
MHRFGSLAISVAVVGSGMAADAAPVVADVVAPTTIDGRTRLISADTIKRVSGSPPPTSQGPKRSGTRGPVDEPSRSDVSLTVRPRVGP